MKMIYNKIVNNDKLTQCLIAPVRFESIFETEMQISFNLHLSTFNIIRNKSLP